MFHCISKLHYRGILNWKHALFIILGTFSICLSLIEFASAQPPTLTFKVGSRTICYAYAVTCNAETVFSCPFCDTTVVAPKRFPLAVSLTGFFFRSLFKFRSNTCCCRRRRRHWLFGWSKFMGKIDNLSFEFESRVVARLKVNKLNSGKKNFNSFFLVCGAFKRIECYNGGEIDIRRHV